MLIVTIKLILKILRVILINYKTKATFSLSTINKIMYLIHYNKKISDNSYNLITIKKFKSRIHKLYNSIAYIKNQTSHLLM